METWEKEKNAGNTFFPSQVISPSQGISGFPTGMHVETRAFLGKEFADDNFRFDEMAESSIELRVEKNVRKGEIVQYEQFLLFSLCFQTLVQ